MSETKTEEQRGIIINALAALVREGPAKDPEDDNVSRAVVCRQVCKIRDANDKLRTLIKEKDAKLEAAERERERPEKPAMLLATLPGFPPEWWIYHKGAWRQTSGCEAQSKWFISVDREASDKAAIDLYDNSEV